MGIIEIIVIIVISILVLSSLSYIIYKKLIKKEPIGECECCSKKGSSLIKEYRKIYPKK